MQAADSVFGVLVPGTMLPVARRVEALTAVIQRCRSSGGLTGSLHPTSFSEG
jgi:hypothetical protein